MIAVFFGVDGIALLDILPTGVKLTFDYFCDSIIEAIEQVAYPDGRAQLAMLFTSTMHLSTKLKKFNKDSMSAGSTD
jgi:hypothetical protein